MGKGTKGIIIIAVFVLLLGGAYVLYNKLGAGVETNQLSTESGINTEENKQESGKDETNSNEDGQNQDSTSNGADQNDSEEDHDHSEEAMQAPDFTVYDTEGNAVKLSDYFGKPIVLNFWASWCGPCRMEMPEFEEKSKELAGEVHFLMVNMTQSGQETLEEATSYIEEEGYTFPVLYDTEGEAMTTYGVYSYPTSYFIDKDGHLIARATGAIDGETLEKAIDTIYKPAE